MLEMLDAVIQRYEIPTQACVLTHVTTSIEAINRGVPLDLVFQSIAGTEAANASFGVSSVFYRKVTRRGCHSTAARSDKTSCTLKPGRAARCLPMRIMD